MKYSKEQMRSALSIMREITGRMPMPKVQHDQVDQCLELFKYLIDQEVKQRALRAGMHPDDPELRPSTGLIKLKI